MWDLLISGGRVVDPASGLDGPADVAVRDGLIAVVEPGLPAGRAANLVDASGRLVTPGLVDLHTHVWHGAGYWSLDPEPVAWRTGVTTWLDAGSAGAYGMDGLRRHVADRSALRIRALINVSGLGLTGPTGEHLSLDNLDVGHAAAVAARHAGFVRGVKARIDARTVGPHGLEPLRRAAELATSIERPLMVHVAGGPPHIADIVPLLREGDILTHCASGAPADLVVDGKLSDAARAALDRGVIFDLGHGMGSFSFDVLEAELAGGVRPIISSDLHELSARGPAYDLPTVMTKLLAVGWGLSDVVAATTVRPARVIGDDAGTLTPGSPADIAVFEAGEGRFPVTDVPGAERIAPLRLTNTATYVGGRLLPPRIAGPPPPWIAT